MDKQLHALAGFPSSVSSMKRSKSKLSSSLTVSKSSMLISNGLLG